MAGADANASSSLPHNIDAVIDLDPHASLEERGVTDPSRTLHTRGLPDSSIRTTLLKHGEEASPVKQTQPLKSPEATGQYVRTLSQTLLSVVSGKVSPSPQPAASSPNSAKDLSSHSPATSPHCTVSISDISSWTAASWTLNTPDTEGVSFLVPPRQIGYNS